MKPPSSTITWATIAGMVAAFLWEMIDTFTDIEPSLGAVGVSVSLVAGIVGKLVPERRYKMTERTE